MDVATAKRILEQALAGQKQDDWQVYWAKRAYLIGEASLYIFFGLFIVSVGVVMSWILFVPPAVITGAVPDGSTIASVGFCVLFFVVMGTILLGVAGAKLNSLRSVELQAIVITPQGFVARTGLRDWQIFVVAYERLESVKMNVTNEGIRGSITLNMVVKPANANGSSHSLSWEVDHRFGATDAIAQAIIAGQARYAATHAVGTAPRGEDAGVTSA